jgi:hypothetical protein
MKQVVDQVRMSFYNEHKSIIQFFIRKKLRALLGKEVVFDRKKLIIKKPGLDSKKIKEINTSYISFHVELEDLKEMLGLYDVVQTDTDTFILKKVKDA